MIFNLRPNLESNWNLKIAKYMAKRYVYFFPLWVLFCIYTLIFGVLEIPIHQDIYWPYTWDSLSLFLGSDFESDSTESWRKKIFFGHSIQHVGFCFPDQGLNLCPLHWKHGVLITGLQGNSKKVFTCN